MTSAPVTTVAQSASKYISDEEQEEKVQIRRGLSFWAIITALCVMSILTALENTAVTTSLPVIVQELNMGENYIWVTNVFFLTRYIGFYNPRYAFSILKNSPVPQFSHSLANLPTFLAEDGLPCSLY